MKSSVKLWIRGGLAALMLAGLAACGGGGTDEPGVKPAIGSGQAGNGSGGGTGARPGTVTLSLTDAGGSAGSFMANGKPLTAVATVLDGKGAPVANALTSFDISDELATMNPPSGMVATDSQGKAKITLSPAALDSSGAGLLTVVAVVKDSALENQAVVSVGASKLALKLVTPASGSVALKAYDSTVITIDVLSDDALLASQSVELTLSSPCAASGKADLPAKVGTINGRAQLVYRDKGCAQADLITASAAGTGQAVAIKVALSAPDVASILVSNVMPAERAIVIKGAGGNGRVETATVTFKVVDQFGNPLANQLVNFATISTKAVGLSRSSDTSDASGEVIAAVNSGLEPTAVRVQATLANGLSTISDTIAVTTGLPIQAAFSLSAETYNMEGRDYDNVINVLSVLIADQFGNPVADGTPVVFQTDGGAVGSADRGGCNTVNGRCTVELRSQNPRYYTDAEAPQKRAGLATVSVSSLANTSTPLTGRLSVFMSASRVGRVTELLDGGASRPITGAINLSTTSCAPYPLRLRLSDVNGNPLPSGTTLEGKASDALEVLDIFPSQLSSIGPAYLNGVVQGDQGSEHLIMIRPEKDRCGAGAGSVTGSTIIAVTSPKGVVSTIAVTLKYPNL